MHPNYCSHSNVVKRLYIAQWHTTGINFNTVMELIFSIAFVVVGIPNIAIGFRPPNRHSQFGKEVS